jgi:hypothetical protein
MQILWDGLVSKDFVLKTLNRKRNRDFNLAKTLCHSLEKKREESSGGGEERSHVSDSAQSDCCLYCGAGGTLMICEHEGCRDVAHGECENLSKKQVKALPQYFCPKHKRMVCSNSLMNLPFLASGLRDDGLPSDQTNIEDPPNPPHPNNPPLLVTVFNPPILTIPRTNSPPLNPSPLTPPIFTATLVPLCSSPSFQDVQSISEKLALLSMQFSNAGCSKLITTDRMSKLQSLITLVNCFLQEPVCTSEPPILPQDPAQHPV